MDFTVTFIRIFFWGVYLTYPILVAIFLIIISLGLIVGRIESWTKFNSIYLVATFNFHSANAKIVYYDVGMSFYHTVYLLH